MQLEVEFGRLPPIWRDIIPNVPIHQQKRNKDNDKRQYDRAKMALIILKGCLIQRNNTYAGAYNEWVFYNARCPAEYPHYSPETYCSHCTAMSEQLNNIEQYHFNTRQR